MGKIGGKKITLVKVVYCLIFNTRYFIFVWLFIFATANTHSKNQTQQTPELVQAETKDKLKPDKKSEAKLDKWVWIGLSVLAVGLIAAVAGGDDGADQNSGAKPETGSIIISGPGP